MTRHSTLFCVPLFPPFSYSIFLTLRASLILAHSRFHISHCIGIIYLGLRTVLWRVIAPVNIRTLLQ